ncbi:MAG: acetyltransferase [Fidelibacterota bacterium]
MTNVIVFGAGEYGALIENLLSYSNEFEIEAFCDDGEDKIGSTKEGKPVLSFENGLKYANEKLIKHAVIAVGNNRIRYKKYHLFKENNFKMIQIIHPKSLIDTHVTIGENTIVEMGTAIHTRSIIGNNVFLGGDALIGHHNMLGDHVLVGGNASFGGSVKVGDFSTIGVGSAIKPGITIGENSIVGVGAVVVKDVPDNVIVAGVPAKIIGENE